MRAFTVAKAKRGSAMAFQIEIDENKTPGGEY
jgi:hypothetical protein